MKVGLYVIGALLEFAGLILLAYPDLIPGAVRAAAWGRRRRQLAENRVRRLLRRPPRHFAHTVTVSGSIGASGSMSAVVSTNPDQPVEGKVEFLLRRDQEAQRRLNDLAERVERVERETAARIAETRTAMETHVTRETAAAIADHRAARLAGAGLLALGLALSTWGNLA